MITAEQARELQNETGAARERLLFTVSECIRKNAEQGLNKATMRFNSVWDFKVVKEAVELNGFKCNWGIVGPIVEAEFSWR